MELDEFTFPTTNPSTPIDSPPLWRLSPSASPTPSYNQSPTTKESNFVPKKRDQNGNFYSRKSCSFLEGKCLMKRSKMGTNNHHNTMYMQDDDQEKMDMIWEDLNYEELFKNNHGFNPKLNNEVVEFGCVPASFRLVRTNNMKNNTFKKPSFFVFVKIIKRLFVLQQSAKNKSS